MAKIAVVRGSIAGFVESMLYVCIADREMEQVCHSDEMSNTHVAIATRCVE